MSKWIDVTQSLGNETVYWPGQEKPRFELISNMEDGHMANVTKIDMSVHTSTHMDAPLHFIQGGKDISEMPIDIGIGKVRVMEHRSDQHISAADIKKYEGRSRAIEKNDRLFFKTSHSNEDWIEKDFDEDYIGLTSEAAEFLRKRGVQLVGIDYLSIAPFSDLISTHNVLLGNNIWVVEGLQLREITEAEYELICLPLKIKNSDGSPVRVLLKPLK